MTSHKNLSRRILGPYRLSHHPLCENFNSHVYYIKRKRICRGCTMQYLGMLIAFFIIVLESLFDFWSHFSDIQIGIILYLLIIPTIITTFLVKNRKMKDFSRFLLGMSFTIAFILLIFTPNLLIKAWILINFIPGYLYLNKRRADHNEQVCQQCSEYATQPYCSGYQNYAEREELVRTQIHLGGVKDPFSLPPERLDQ